MKDGSGNNLFVGAAVMAEGKRGTVVSIRNDDHFARVAFPDGEIIFAVSREIFLVREGHHSECSFSDCQGGCWDMLDQ
jgi:hypothetical protein